MPPDEPGPFHESFVLYQNPHDGTITGVNYSGELCKQFGYLPPAVPELFEMEGTEITEEQNGVVVGTGQIELTQKFVGDGGTYSVSLGLFRHI